MHATVYKDEFLKEATNLLDSGVSIATCNGSILVTSFEHNISFKVTAYVINPGQIYFPQQQWERYLSAAQTVDGNLLELIANC